MPASTSLRVGHPLPRVAFWLLQDSHVAGSGSSSVGDHSTCRRVLPRRFIFRNAIQPGCSQLAGNLMFRLLPLLSLIDSLPLMSRLTHVLLYLVKSLFPDINPRSGLFLKRYKVPLQTLAVQTLGPSVAIYQTQIATNSSLSPGLTFLYKTSLLFGPSFNVDYGGSTNRADW